jgi:hypothetical protein
MAFADKKQASKYVYDFTKEKYDRISVLLPKGRKKEMQDYLRALTPRISVNEYINKLIEFDMQPKAGTGDPFRLIY